MRSWASAAFFAVSFAMPGHAAVMNFGGTTVAGEGIVSRFQGTPNTVVETFGSPGACGLTTAVVAIGGVQVASDSVFHRRAAPAGDTGCYVATSGLSRGSTIVFDFAAIAGEIDYLGFYWGSIDPFRSNSLLQTTDENAVGLYNRRGEALSVVAFGTDPITGGDFLAYSGTAAYASNFAEFRFASGENLGFLSISTLNYAFELDHLTWRTRPAALANDGVTDPVLVPEPAPLVLLGVALAGLAVRRRRTL